MVSDEAIAIIDWLDTGRQIRGCPDWTHVSCIRDVGGIIQALLLSFFRAYK